MPLVLEYTTKMKGRLKYWLKYLAVLAVLLIFTVFLYIILNKHIEKPLMVAVLNIGQGDAIYVRAPNGTDMLVDSGRDRKVMSELGSVMSWGDHNINIIEASNPDLDHIGGFPFVMDKFKIDEILSPRTMNSTEIFDEIEKKVLEKHIKVLLPKSGDKIILDKNRNIYYEILWPEGNVRDWESNGGSMVGLLVYGTHKILLTGDAPSEVEDILVKKYPKELKDIDILKVGHHGSRTATGGALVLLARPKIALISAGLHNKYGHPHKEVLDRLTQYHIPYLVTATHGRIVCNIWVGKMECK